MDLRTKKAKKRTGPLSKFKPETILELIKNSNGVVKDIAAGLGLKGTKQVYEWLDENPDGQEALDTARHYIRQDVMDEREQGVKTIAERIDEDPGVALRACIWYLETHGKGRGYGKEAIDKEASADKLVDALVALNKASKIESSK